MPWKLVSTTPSGTCVPCEDFTGGCVTPCYGVTTLANTYVVDIVYFTNDCQETEPTSPADPITISVVVTREGPDVCGWRGEALAGPLYCPVLLTNGRYFRARVFMFPDENGWVIEIAIDARFAVDSPWFQQGDLCTFVRNVSFGTGPVGSYTSETCTTEEFFDSVEVS